MSFRGLFPWTYAFLRFSAPRPARIAATCFCCALLAMMAFFRVESLLFQRRVASVLSRMTELRLDHTSEQEVRKLLPELKLVRSEDDQVGHDYEFKDSNMEGGILLVVLDHAGDHSLSLVHVLNVLGHRFHLLVVSCRVQDQHVSAVHFWLLAESSGRTTYDDLVAVEVSGYSHTGLQKRKWGESYEDISPYSVMRASNRPKTSLDVRFTDAASQDFVRAAFDARLNCLWNFSGCNSTQQLLPGVWSPRFKWNR